jgi:Mor family transcriptional regulator
MGKNDISLADDLIMVCSRAVDSQTAQKGIRALCRYFGGQMICVPKRKKDGKSAEKIRGVLADAVGDEAARAMLDKLMISSGRLQIYIPFERHAFKTTIALEIFERYGKDGVSMNDLAREYGISFTHAYRLWQKGQHEKYHRSTPYLPFLEFSQ